MNITENTKISVLIRENIKVIDAIASINKHFEKLKNPVLRKILASRVTIKDAAKIGGTDVQTFFDKLKPLGFCCNSDDEPDKETETEIPDFYKNRIKEKMVEMDVRDDLANGRDPFNRIMEALEQLPGEYTLKLINTFEPIPLLNILKRKRYASYIVRKGPSLIVTYLKYTGEKVNESAESIIAFIKNNVDAEKIITAYGERIRIIDVCDLEAPLPMITILGELDLLPKDTLLYVHHKKVPQFLLPELKERDYSCMVQEIAEGCVKLLIYK